MTFDDVSAMVGQTPCLKTTFREAPRVTFHIKLEGYNPTGSLKDRTCLSLLRDAVQSGRLRPGQTLLDASSGNMACALAFYGRLLGYRTHVVVSSKLTKGKQDFVEYFGAAITWHGDFTIDGNRLCRSMVAQEPGRYCFLDQLHNWANPRAHFETTAPEILADVPDVAAVIGSLGSGGALLGIGEFFKQRRPEVPVVAVQSARGTRIPGVGSFGDGDYVTPFIQRGRESGFFDHTIEINDADARHRSDQLRDRGVFGGLQTGAILGAALAFVERAGIHGDVLLLSGDTGWKNMDKLLGTSTATPLAAQIPSSLHV